MKDLEAEVMVIDPLEQERRYKVKGPDGRQYALREENKHWILISNNKPIGSINPGAIGTINLLIEAQGRRTWREVGLYERDRNGSYWVGPRENFENRDNSLKKEIHPLDYLLRAVALPEVPPAREDNKPLDDLASASKVKIPENY